MDSNLNCNEFFGFQLFEDLDDVIKADIVIDNADFAQIDEVLYQHHPEGSPKPDEDNPLVQGLVKKLIARFNEDRAMKISDRRIWYKRVTGETHRYELEVDKATILRIEENEVNHIGFIVVHSHPNFHGKTINAQLVVKSQVKSKTKSKQKPIPLPPNHKCPIKVTSQDNVEAVYVDFQDNIFQTCHGGVVKAKTNENIKITPLMISSQETDEFGKQIGKCEAAGEIKLVLFPIPEDLYEDIKAKKKTMVDITNEMVQAHWEEPVKFLRYVRPNRDLEKPVLSKGVINWPSGADVESKSSAKSRKRIFRENYEEFFATLDPEEQIEEIEYLEKRLAQIANKKFKIM